MTREEIAAEAMKIIPKDHDLPGLGIFRMAMQNSIVAGESMERALEHADAVVELEQLSLPTIDRAALLALDTKPTNAAPPPAG